MTLLKPTGEGSKLSSYHRPKEGWVVTLVKKVKLGQVALMWAKRGSKCCRISAGLRVWSLMTLPTMPVTRVFPPSEVLGTVLKMMG